MNTEERLESMERELARMGGEQERSRRRNRLAVAGAVIAMVAAGLITWAAMSGAAMAQFRAEPHREEPPVIDQIRAREINIVDWEGKSRIVLTIREEGPAIILNDEMEKPRNVLGMFGDAVGLLFKDENGKDRVIIGVEEDEAKLIIIGENLRNVITSEGAGTERVRPTGVPEEILRRPISVINVETLELFETTVGEWELEFKINPETGYKIDNKGRKISIPMTCISCKERIPPAPISIDIAIAEEYERIIRDYKCPKCARNAYPDMGF